MLTERLASLLDDRAGTPRAGLVPLLDAVGGMPRPWGGITWVGRPHIQRILRSLATGETPPTHGGLSQLGGSRTTAYLRDLLMQHGVLPDQDRHLLTFESWLTSHLSETAEPHRQLLDQYATWHVLRKLRDVAARQPRGSGRDKDARLKIRKADEFLTFPLRPRPRPEPVHAG